MNNLEKIFNEIGLEFRESKILNGLWMWPREDIGCWKHLNKKRYSHTPYEISKFCKTRRLVIQAGGNCGVYPKQYSSIFSSVITFEPSYENFFCLNFNVDEKNVYKFNCALGNSTVPVNINYLLDSNNEINVGNVRTVIENGKIPQMMIDSLGVDPDLIHLDIEGFEPFALMGAEQTIKRCRPIIALEINESLKEYNWSEDQVVNLLHNYGYEKLSQINSLDSVWGYKENI
jgi:FkbM family methyltransferase